MVKMVDERGVIYYDRTLITNIYRQGFHFNGDLVQFYRMISYLKKYANLSRDAKKEFETNNSDKQKQLLANLGLNLLFKDKKLHILDIKPLIVLEKISQEVKTIHQRLEPVKNGINKRTLGEIYAQSPTLLRGWDSNPRPID